MEESENIEFEEFTNNGEMRLSSSELTALLRIVETEASNRRVNIYPLDGKRYADIDAIAAKIEMALDRSQTTIEIQ